VEFLTETKTIFHVLILRKQKNRKQKIFGSKPEIEPVSVTSGVVIAGYKMKHLPMK